VGTPSGDPRHLDRDGGWRELTALIALRGKPVMIVSDNGTEFTCTCNAMLTWSEDHRRPHPIAPGNTNGRCH
jgi:hypothetical protein